jgi:superfamily II DNA or RNA helicase
MVLKKGIYELVIDEQLQKTISESSDEITRLPIDKGETFDVLSTYLQQQISKTLHSLSGDELDKQIDIANKIVNILRDAQSDIEQNKLHGANQLLEVRDKFRPAYLRPDTPLSRSCLLARTKSDPTLLSQIKKEISSANRIDIICSFIKWSGLRCMVDELKEFTNNPDNKLRVITTSYMGATDLKAVEFFRELPNTEVKLSYDRDKTRLHAKAFIFHRETNFSTAYIGSANISNAALTEGLEWNVKISQYESQHLWDKVTASFETHWFDGEFSSYIDGDQDKLSKALDEAISKNDDSLMPIVDLRPYPFQQEILDRIAYERYAGRNSHLIIAATGTGKTIIGAFDYRNFIQSHGGKEPKMLFIAHREEILKQSLATFRIVLRDANFGDLYVGGNRPKTLNHLFMSIQTFHYGELWNDFPADFFDYIIVDEFHRAEALTYQTLLNHFKPKSLIGLTATPERADGGDIFRYFGWHTTAEIRLPDAINRKLLCPFHYFGVSDVVDLTDLKWQRGGYIKSELDELYSTNDIRAAHIITSCQRILLNVKKAKGLGFCVSVAHAKYMSERFNKSGIPSISLTSDSSTDERNTAQKKLRHGEINFIFSVDLYNEGVDIPEIDTVLFLRPTESLTIFLQQLGRGLRHNSGKECLTVLDFVGAAHDKYRFDIRYRALLDDPSRAIGKQVANDFPHLPAGCLVKLERKAKEYILENIKRNLRNGKERIIEAVREEKERLERMPIFSEFLEITQLEPEDIYRRKDSSWSRLCADNGLLPQFSNPDEIRLSKGLRRIEHINGPKQIEFLLKILNNDMVDNKSLTTSEMRLLAMMHSSLWGNEFHGGDEISLLNKLKQNDILCDELRQLLIYQQGRIASPPDNINLPFTCPLEVHASYTRDELLAGLGHWHPSMQSGVLHLPIINADIFLCTLNKTETEYSPSTMYEDYAFGPDMFHWQSQSTTSASSKTGQRYINHKKNDHTILLCVREYKDVNNLASPYYFLGPANYVSHTGSNPMSIIWQLQSPMPAALLRRTARVVNG